MSKKTQAKSSKTKSAPARKAAASKPSAGMKSKTSGTQSKLKPSKPLRALAAMAAKITGKGTSKSAGKKTGPAPKAVKAVAKPAVTKGGKASVAPAKSAAKQPVTTGKKTAAPAKAAAVTKAAGKTVAAAPAGKKGAKGAAPVAAAPVSPPAKGAKGKAGRAAKGLIAGASGTARPYDSDNCRETACETFATTGGYCRLHYIKNWKKIKRKELILKEKKLNQYIEELVAKYPEKYIEAIRQDLADEKAFSKVIYDLELDENVEDIEIEGENDEDIIEGIKRGFEDGDPEF